jgi:hypothetical protein
MRLKLKLDGLSINWQGPDQTPPDRCSFCEAPFTEDDVPLSMWSSEGWCASFCDDCAPANVEVEQQA